jgi:hypothetical protein
MGQAFIIVLRNSNYKYVLEYNGASLSVKISSVTCNLKMGKTESDSIMIS